MWSIGRARFTARIAATMLSIIINPPILEPYFSSPFKVGDIFTVDAKHVAPDEAECRLDWWQELSDEKKATAEWKCDACGRRGRGFNWCACGKYFPLRPDWRLAAPFFALLNMPGAE